MESGNCHNKNTRKGSQYQSIFAQLLQSDYDISLKVYHLEIKVINLLNTFFTLVDHNIYDEHCLL